MRRAAALAFLPALLSCSAPEPPRGFTLRIATAAELSRFHPRTTSSFTAAAVDLVYRPILRAGGDGQLLPGAVRAWERLAADRIRVQMDPELRFSDGSPVRAEDLVSSLSGYGLKVRPTGEWLDIGPGSSRDPLEVTLLSPAVFKDASPVPLGTGPFAFVEGDARHIVLRRVRPEPGRIARVEIEVVATPRDAFARALRGEVNAVMGLDDRQSELMEGVPGLRTVRGEGPHTVAVVMNAARFSPGERLGLAASLPLPELVRAYGGGCAPVGAGAAAERPPPGRPLMVAASAHDPGLPRAALALRRALGGRGGEVALEPMARALARARAQDFDLSVRTVVAWPPVMLGWLARTGASANWAGYSNPLVDQAFDRGDLAAVQEEMGRDPPLVLICRRQRIAAVDARIRNPSLGSWGLLDTLPDWEVGP